MISTARRCVGAFNSMKNNHTYNHDIRLRVFARRPIAPCLLLSLSLSSISKTFPATTTTSSHCVNRWFVVEGCVFIPCVSIFACSFCYTQTHANTHTRRRSIPTKWSHKMNETNNKILLILCSCRMLGYPNIIYEYVIFS